MCSNAEHQYSGIPPIGKSKRSDLYTFIFISLPGTPCNVLLYDTPCNALLLDTPCIVLFYLALLVMYSFLSGTPNNVTCLAILVIYCYMALLVIYSDATVSFTLSYITVM